MVEIRQLTNASWSPVLQISEIVQVTDVVHESPPLNRASLDLFDPMEAMFFKIEYLTGVASSFRSRNAVKVLVQMELAVIAARTFHAFQPECAYDVRRAALRAVLWLDP
jgi:hypothetical protein